MLRVTGSAFDSVRLMHRQAVLAQGAEIQKLVRPLSEPTNGYGGFFQLPTAVPSVNEKMYNFVVGKGLPLEKDTLRLTPRQTEAENRLYRLRVAGRPADLDAHKWLDGRACAWVSKDHRSNLVAAGWKIDYEGHE